MHLQSRDVRATKLCREVGLSIHATATSNVFNWSTLYDLPTASRALFGQIIAMESARALEHLAILLAAGQ